MLNFSILELYRTQVAYYSYWHNPLYLLPTVLTIQVTIYKSMSIALISIFHQLTQLKKHPAHCSMLNGNFQRRHCMCQLDMIVSLQRRSNAGAYNVIIVCHMRTRSQKSIEA